MMSKPSTDELQKALEITNKIMKKAADLLAPLELEMQIMKWKPEYRRIMLEAVERHVCALKEATK